MQNLFLYTPRTPCVCRLYPNTGIVEDVFLTVWYNGFGLQVTVNRHLIEQAVILAYYTSIFFLYHPYAFKPPMALAAVRSKAVVLLLSIRCCLLLTLWDSVIVLCVVVRYFVSILALQSSRWGRESRFALFVFLMSRDCCMAFPQDTSGLSAVCD